MAIIKIFLQDIRTQKTPFHGRLYRAAKKMRMVRIPFPRFYGAVLFHTWGGLLIVWRRFKQLFFYDSMLRYRCKRVGKGVYFESTFPLIMGYGNIYLGDRLGISGHVTFIASYKANPNPTIEIGEDVYLGYGSFFSCADRITIGNRVLIAQGVSIFDNNNHPIDAVARAKNQTIGKVDFSPVVIEDDAWIGAKAVILKGVTVGRGAVVATESVVTHDVPPMTVVAGNPAEVVKKIPISGANMEVGK